MLATTFKTLSEFVSFLAQSFKLAAIVPAFVFLLLNQVVILPLLPGTDVIADFLMWSISYKFTLLTVLAFLLGYTLTILNIPLIRLFEGYPWCNTWYGQRLIKRKLLQKQTLQIELAKHMLAEIAAEASDQQNDNSIRYELIKLQLSEQFPEDDTFTLPTSLGNTIAAFEDYPFQRYSIDTITIWPRLVPILSAKQYSVFIEREKAALDFMINFSFLFTILSIEVTYISLLYSPNIYASLRIGGVFFLFALICYRIAVVAAGSWGMTVKVAFDLHRYSLLDALKIDIAKLYGIEKNAWIAVSDFFKRGNREEWSKFSALIDYSTVNKKVE